MAAACRVGFAVEFVVFYELDLDNERHAKCAAGSVAAADNRPDTHV